MSIITNPIAVLDEDQALVTGSARLIESHLVDALLGQDKQVHVLDNFSSGHLVNLETARRAFNFTLFKGTLLNPSDVLKALEGCWLKGVGWQSRQTSVQAVCATAETLFEIASCE